MTGDDSTDVLVIGGGMAGLAASYHAAARGASVVCVESALYGGLVASVGEIDDFPLTAATAGAALADAYRSRGADLGVEFVADEIKSLSAGGAGVQAKAETRVRTARRVIVATGGRRRLLGVAREAELTKRGISDCAWCDGGLYRGQSVAVIGGGDSALQAALYLAGFCERVTLVVRGLELRARRRYTLLAADNGRIAFAWQSAVESFVGDDALVGVRVRDEADGSVVELPVTGAFVYVGIVPASECLPVDMDRDADGLVVTDGSGRSSNPGIYAAGAIRSGCSGGVTAALADGANVAAAVVADLARDD